MHNTKTNNYPHPEKKEQGVRFILILKSLGQQ